MANVKSTIESTTTTYATQRGIVVGKMYGGGKGIYAARNFKADSLKELKAKFNNAFEIGSLDAGFGFDKLLAAGTQIVTTTVIVVDGKEYTNVTTENYVIGDTDLFEECLDAGDFYDDLDVDAE